MGTTSLHDLWKWEEFNRTEPETLTRLVHEAIEKGGKAREENANLRKRAQDLYQALEAVGFLKTLVVTDSDEWLKKRVTAIDGSNQLIGGIGGLWYAPTSVAIITFEEGIKGKVAVHVAAHIHEIQEEGYKSVNTEVARLMFEGETKAIMSWGKQRKESVLFIDGPIVDPPVYADANYIEFRCQAIRECLRVGVLLIGCAKRVKDIHIRKHLTKKVLKEHKLQVKAERFPTDLQLTSFLFAQHWHKRSKDGESIYTQPVDVSKATAMYKKYHAEGITIFSIFIQKSIRDYVLRLDVPFLNNDVADGQKVRQRISDAISVAISWTYPGQGLPLPVFLADEKCEVRRGCAQVLYDEIMTGSRTTDPIDQIVSLQLEARL